MFLFNSTDKVFNLFFNVNVSQRWALEERIQVIMKFTKNKRMIKDYQQILFTLTFGKLIYV